LRDLIGAEPISEPGLRDQEARPARVGLKFVTKILDADTQIPGVVLAIGTPDFSQKLPLSHDHACLARKTL